MQLRAPIPQIQSRAGCEMGAMAVRRLGGFENGHEAGAGNLQNARFGSQDHYLGDIQS
jgi:hypothetical protein